MGKGWEKENYPNILGRKYIDKSILKYGTVIPLKLINNFLDNVSGKLVQRGESKNISLIIDGQKYEAIISNADRKDVNTDTIRILYSGNKDLLHYLNNKFKYTLDLINLNSKVDTDEYIDFSKGKNIN